MIPDTGRYRLGPKLLDRWWKRPDSNGDRVRRCGKVSTPSLAQRSQSSGALKADMRALHPRKII